MKITTRVAVVVVFMTTAGCGKQADVAGTVTLDGKPLVFGTVMIETADGTIKQANIDKDGKYTIAGVKPGDVRVAVNSPNPKSGALVPIRGEGRVPDQPGWFPIPERFGAVDTSGLAYTLKGGGNNINIEMAK